MNSKRKLAVIISINDKYNYPIRTKYSTKVFNELGYDVIVVSSDFDHRTKQKYNDTRSDLIQLPTKSYDRNLSVGRILSLVDFSHKAFKKVVSLNPQLIYVSGPPNTQYKFFSKYKKKHPGTILIAEIGDMWPESLPLSKKLKKLAFLPLKMWALLRDNYLNKFDFVITECELFEEMLSKSVDKAKLKTIYFCKEDLKIIDSPQDIEFNIITLAYVGSVNNIIDIDLIVKTVMELMKYKPVEFHLIAAGEKKEELCKAIKCTECKLIDHGEVYDANKKEKILSKCLFAFNVMKDSVCVGMTMKSLDYFQYGIPILNNITGDIWNIVNEEGVGLNISHENLASSAKKIAEIDSNMWLEMRKKTIDFFDKKFSVKAFEAEFRKVIERR